MNGNAVTWFEIPVSDLARAKAFYESIFQLSLRELPLPTGLRLAMFPVEPGSVGGALACHPEFYTPSASGTLVYLNASPDLGAVLARVDSAGGSVVVPKTQISEDYGFMAVIKDSEGNRVALHSMA